MVRVAILLLVSACGARGVEPAEPVIPTTLASERDQPTDTGPDSSDVSHCPSTSDDVPATDLTLELGVVRPAPDSCPPRLPRFIQLTPDEYRESILETIRRGTPRSASDCFIGSTDHLACHPATVVVAMTVSSSGLLEHLCVEGADDALASCVDDVLRPLRFPEPETGSVDLRFEIRFSIGR